MLERVGISEAEVPALRAILERAVPKNRGAEFLDLIEDVANDTCLETDPECPRCELRKVCTYALSHKPGAHAPAHASGTAGAARPRNRSSRRRPKVPASRTEPKQ